MYVLFPTADDAAESAGERPPRNETAAAVRPAGQRAGRRRGAGRGAAKHAPLLQQQHQPNLQFSQGEAGREA